MLIFGPYRACIKAISLIEIKDPYIIINYSSYTEDIPRDPALIPAIDPNKNYDIELLETQYHEYLINDPHCNQIICNILYNLMNGNNAYICTSGEDIQNNYLKWMTDCFQSFFSKRYGYNAAVINNGEDILYCDSGSFHFSVSGIMQADQDLEKYTFERVKEDIKMGRPLPTSE